MKRFLSSVFFLVCVSVQAASYPAQSVNMREECLRRNISPRTEFSSVFSYYAAPTEYRFVVDGGIWPVTKNIAIPGNITLDVQAGSYFQSTNGYTLNIQGGLIDSGQPMFDCEVTGLAVSHPEMFLSNGVARAAAAVAGNTARATKFAGVTLGTTTLTSWETGLSSYATTNSLGSLIANFMLSQVAFSNVQDYTLYNRQVLLGVSNLVTDLNVRFLATSNAFTTLAGYLTNDAIPVLNTNDNITKTNFMVLNGNMKIFSNAIYKLAFDLYTSAYFSISRAFTNYDLIATYDPPTVSIPYTNMDISGYASAPLSIGLDLSGLGEMIATNYVFLQGGFNSHATLIGDLGAATVAIWQAHTDLNNNFTSISNAYTDTVHVVNYNAGVVSNNALVANTNQWNLQYVLSNVFDYVEGTLNTLPGVNVSNAMGFDYEWEPEDGETATITAELNLTPVNLAGAITSIAQFVSGAYVTNLAPAVVVGHTVLAPISADPYSVNSYLWTNQTGTISPSGSQKIGTNAGPIALDNVFVDGYMLPITDAALPRGLYCCQGWYSCTAGANFAFVSDNAQDSEPLTTRPSLYYYNHLTGDNGTFGFVFSVDGSAGDDRLRLYTPADTLNTPGDVIGIYVITYRIGVSL